MKKEDYAALYTLRKDGRYQGYYRDAAGKRHVICDRDPAELYRRLLERSGAPVKEDPSVRLFSSVASRWEREHRRTEKSSKGHSTGEVTTAAILGAVVGAVIAKNT